METGAETMGMRGFFGIAMVVGLAAGAAVAVNPAIAHGQRLSGAPANATQSEDEERDREALPPPAPLRPSDQTRADPGKPVKSAFGRPGERQRRELANGIVPLDRLATRIPNRVEARLRNRIDRFYDPQANAVSPFKVAGEQTRRQGQARR